MSCSRSAQDCGVEPLGRGRRQWTYNTCMGHCGGYNSKRWGGVGWGDGCPYRSRSSSVWTWEGEWGTRSTMGLSYKFTGSTMAAYSVCGVPRQWEGGRT